MSIVNNLFNHKSNERMRQLIKAIRTRDFSLQYSLDHLRGEERNLAEQINEVVNEFRETILLQEAKYQYFGTMLDTINAFLIVADEQGKVHWMNRAAVEGLCGFSIQHLQDLQVLDGALPEMMMQLKPGLQKLMQLETKTNEAAAGKKALDAGNQNAGKADFVLSVVNFFNKGFVYRLYTLQNVQPVIQKNETDAQQQLVRVLTHEIMNSLTPIISLADTLCEGVEQDTLEHDDLLMALQAINRRSNGLLQFVENYRKLQRISKPLFEDVRIGDLVADLQHLYPDSIFHYEIENEDQRLLMDRSQIEQVLINLLKNAQEAVENRVNDEAESAQNQIPYVRLTTHLSSNKRNFIISITDNGKGILPEVMERIFVPFFTTKTSGSGIGLSICKQIVTLHGGTITASSKPDDKTTFSVVLPV
ncbi:ATP-binding protein [Segatella copri]|uniref:sensor histidine kinase n=1 Tax=Segatella copri TaxID=165179 RepID=UPI00293A0509|nr:ATP-binding protein [Segatella copri]MDV3107248.1 ATP-binding protein [Segatella copri]MDV3114285.1 ATP-binding protein [Segatella copri]